MRSFFYHQLQTSVKKSSFYFALVMLLSIICFCIVGPWLSIHEYDFVYWDYMSMPPDWSKSHYFGTDAIGRDLFVRTLMAGRVSLTIAFIATCVSVLLGVVYGVISGYFGGRVDQLMMRLLDILFALPFMFVVIVLMAMFKGNIWVLYVSIGALVWFDLARVVRGQTVSIRHTLYIEAAYALGQKPLLIIMRHVVPNLLGIVIVYASLTLPQVVLLESFLSFLGLGITEPMTSWGALIKDGSNDLEIAPWSFLFPAFFLIMTLLCFNRLGDAFKDQLNTK